MATSGTVAQTAITVDDLITLAVLNAGKAPSTVGGELLQNIRNALYLMVADLGNDGINLWCLTKSVANVIPGQSSFQLPDATNDVTNALYRTLYAMSGMLVTSASAVTFTPTTPVAVTNITFTFVTAGAANIVIEYTLDGSTWLQQTLMNGVYVAAGAVFTMDIDNSTLAMGWRIRDTSGVLLSLTNVLFRKIANEITMGHMNHDEYTNLPNKQQQGGKSLQYWFDKQIQPRLFVWPVSTTMNDQIVMWAASEVQDPGDLSNALAVPTRWYQSVVDTLSYRVAKLLPPAELAPGRLASLKQDDIDSKKRATGAESDGSSFRLAPRVRGYTR